MTQKIPKTDAGGEPIGTSGHPSDSSAQREAEAAAIAVLAAELGMVLEPRVLDLGGSKVHVDGFGDGPEPVLVEVFAHQGALRPGQRHKVMSDALKLATAARVLFDSKALLIILLTDALTADDLERGWRGAALKAFGVEVRTVALPAEVAARVLQAQGRQGMVNGTARKGA